MDASAQLTALADPTRRAIFELIGKAPSAVSDLTARLTISQPAVSQHLKVLREAHLVRSRPEGTRRIYSVDNEGLTRIRDWLDETWTGVLDAYVNAAHEETS